MRSQLFGGNGRSLIERIQMRSRLPVGGNVERRRYLRFGRTALPGTLCPGREIAEVFQPGFSAATIIPVSREFTLKNLRLLQPLKSSLDGPLAVAGQFFQDGESNVRP